MEGRRSPAGPNPLSRGLTGLTVAAVALLTSAAPARASGHGGGGTAGWYDSSDPGSYHIRAGTTGRHGTTSAGGSGRTAKAPATPEPTYCVEAAAAGRVAAPLAFIAGKPVVCGADATPTVSPQVLARQAWGDLHLPLPDVRTAPPRGSAALVGLPEWIWVPHRYWAPVTRRASAGAAWAEVMAIPKRMSIDPGGGMQSVGCSGPGTAYDPRRTASAQRTDCSYTYSRSSASQPGTAYRVTVTVVWDGSWAGSGGVGGTLPDISRSTTFSLRVGEGQGLYGR